MSTPIQKFIEKVCVQTAVYWGNPQPDGYGGTTFDSATEISCRWDGKTQIVRADNGEEVTSRAEILVTQDIDKNSYLYLGSLSDLTSDEQNDPRKVELAFKVIRVEKSPEFMSTDNFVRVVYL